MFRRLDIAEISYEQKDEILQQLSLIEEHEKQVAFIKTNENQELQNSLFLNYFTVENKEEALYNRMTEVLKT